MPLNPRFASMGLQDTDRSVVGHRLEDQAVQCTHLCSQSQEYEARICWQPRSHCFLEQHRGNFSMSNEHATRQKRWLTHQT